MNVTRKVRYGSAVTVVTGLVTWLLVSYVFHGSVPPDLANALPVIVAAVLGAVTAWWTKHAPLDLRRGVANLATDAKELAEQLQMIQTGGLPNSLPVPKMLTLDDLPDIVAGPKLRAKLAAPLKVYEPTNTLTGTAITHPADGTTSPPVSNPPVLPDGMTALTPTEVELLHSVPPTYESPVRPVPVAPDAAEGPPKVNQQQSLGLDPYGVK